jgi:hypothetical protein
VSGVTVHPVADLHLIRDAATELPVPKDPLAIASLRIWHCKYRSLRDLALFKNVVDLEVATYPDDTFEPLEGLLRLERLRVLHLPKITDLTPLASLTQLRYLSLATLPSWDSSGKVTEVRGLEPVAALPVLAEVELFGVVPPSRRVDDLLRAPALREARVSRYANGESERMAAALARR